MRKRVLSFLLAASAAFCFICSSAPEAQAIVPIGLVQSALASYVTSTGYKMYNDQGTGQDILGSLSDLYQTWLDSPAGAAASQWTLAHIAAIEAVYTDTSGQIVIKKAAADVFQQFADWIQTEYSVPVGSDTPTSVLSPSGLIWSNGAGVNAAKLVCDWSTTIATSSYYLSSVSLGFLNGRPLYSGYNYLHLYPDSVFVTQYNGTLYVASDANYGTSVGLVVVTDRELWSSAQMTATFRNTLSPSSFSDAVPVSTSNPLGVSVIDLDESGGVSGLAVTLAQAVADVVGQAKEDDAVVIGVGASAGATAQDIADMVAQGVKAQTLDPSVSITAEAVIDTPVQPYPDIDGLGLPTLGAALVDRFPFCIPWDFVDTVKLLSADPQPINIKVDLIPQRIKTSVGITSDTSFDIDLSGEEYAKIGVFCRWGSLITFCFGLFLLTKRLVWTA